MILDNISWSKAEKSIARKAFDSAYDKEINSIVSEAKNRLQSYSGPADLWALHDYISKKRVETDNKYDYRYSMLIFVFARLIKDGYLTIADLQGLSEQKIELIRNITNE